jgi:uncharacterized protein (DUF58 family)
MRRAALALGPVLLVLAAAVLGSLGVFALALGLVTLYAGSGLALALGARRVTVERTLDRTETQEGQPLTLRFAVAGLRGLPLRLEARHADATWQPLGATLSCVIERPGVHVLEASALRLRDDLGLFSRAVAGGRPESVLVLPTPLAPERLRPVGAEVSGDPEPDGLRPYTPGTPINRVHWGVAARGGELQERHFATGRDQLPLVVVDTQGADAAAVAWVARSAAGLVLALARAGGCRVLLPGDRVVTTIDDIGAWPAIHRRLAALEPDGATMPVHDPQALFVRAASAPEAPADPLPPGVVSLPDWQAAA